MTDDEYIIQYAKILLGIIAVIYFVITAHRVEHLLEIIASKT